MRTANPALNDNVFQGIGVGGGEVMTLDGTVNKTGISILLTIAAAYVTWTNPQLMPLGIAGLFGGLIVGFIIIFKKNLAPYLTPVYAVMEGRLEIHADEVTASHGATVGQLDEDAIFYLRSRGLDVEAARQLLTMAFCRPVTDAMRPGPLREALSARLDAALQALGSPHG